MIFEARKPPDLWRTWWWSRGDSNRWPSAPWLRPDLGLVLVKRSDWPSPA